MAGHIFGAHPFSEPMVIYRQLDREVQTTKTTMTLELKYKISFLTKCT